eukprot:3831599-Prymnesium_polylepis.2
MEVFDAMGRHVAPERTVVVAPVCVALPIKPVAAQLQLDGGRIRLRLQAHSSSHVRLQLSVRPPEVKHLPAVRCRGLFLPLRSQLGSRSGAIERQPVSCSHSEGA